MNSNSAVAPLVDSLQGLPDANVTVKHLTPTSKVLGSWINSVATHEAKKRRTTQVITCTFLIFSMWKVAAHIGARARPRFELCRRERRHGQETIEHLPEERVSHIQRAGCKARRKIIIGAHNRCWKYLLCVITKHKEVKRDFEFIVRKHSCPSGGNGKKERRKRS